MATTILRMPAVLARVGLSRTQLYRDVADGIWPRPVKLGRRAIGWPADETETLLAARVAGLKPSELRKLAGELLTQRQRGVSPVCKQTERA